MATAVCRTPGCPERWLEHDLGDMDLTLTRAVICGGCGQPAQVDAELGSAVEPEPEPEPTALELLESRIAEQDARIAVLEGKPAEQQ